MIKLFRKNTGSLMNYKKLICLQQTKVLVLRTKKKRSVVWMEKKIRKSLFGEKYLLGKPVHFSVKNTANNADTWGFIQQYFQHLYRTANSIVWVYRMAPEAPLFRGMSTGPEIFLECRACLSYDPEPKKVPHSSGRWDVWQLPPSSRVSAQSGVQGQGEIRGWMAPGFGWALVSLTALYSTGPLGPV